LSFLIQKREIDDHSKWQDCEAFLNGGHPLDHLATGTTSLRLDYRWYGSQRRHPHGYSLGRLVCAPHSSVLPPVCIFLSLRLRKDFPSYINVPTLLIDVVSVMGLFIVASIPDWIFTSLLVAFIPEGLPVAVTLSLAKVAHTLSQKNILCKYVFC
jgi:hypothetical protein